MLKWLLLLALAYVAYRLLVRLPIRETAREKRGDAEQMVECMLCGIHFPKNEAVVREGQSFCSEQHYASWQQRR